MAHELYFISPAWRWAARWRRWCAGGGKAKVTLPLVLAPASLSRPLSVSFLSALVHFPRFLRSLGRIKDITVSLHLCGAGSEKRTPRSCGLVTINWCSRIYFYPLLCLTSINLIIINIAITIQLNMNIMSTVNIFLFLSIMNQIAHDLTNTHDQIAISPGRKLVPNQRISPANGFPCFERLLHACITVLPLLNR